MSNKRPLSPESTNGYVNNDLRSLKRLKLHSIIQELRNEEANLVILKKLRACQQLTTRINNGSSTSGTSTTNGFHPTATRVPVNTKPVTPIPPSASSSRSSLQPVVPAATRKPSIPTNPPLITKLPTSVPTKNPANVPSSYSLEERKVQAKKALRHQLERDLLNIPSPKPLLQDVLFVPNPNSLEFQPYIGLEDVVQCLYELQADRHRLPQRFTDRAQIHEPYVCDHCGTDFTIRWWKHLNASNALTNILCDRCKKQVTRRTLKSDHSSLLKNVFVSAMEQEKEIEKSFQTLMKQQQKSVSRSSTSSSPVKALASNRPLPSSPIPVGMPTMNPIPAHPSPNNHHSHSKPKAKTSVPQIQNFATKLSQQPAVPTNATRKPSAIPQPQVNSSNHVRSNQHTKSAMPTHHHLQQQQQQQYRSASAIPPPSQHSHQSTNLQMGKLPKSAVRQQPAVPQRSSYVPGNTMHSAGNMHTSMAAAVAAAAAAAANARPTATKRRTIPSVNMK